MKKVGFVGWRGMVGSVLMTRMQENDDFKFMQPTFFSTSQVGQPGPDSAGNSPLQDAYAIEALAKMDILLSTQGGEYTRTVHSQLRAQGWQGAWIDAASTLRLDSRSIIVLDPINEQAIDTAIDAGVNNFIGGNCTVSLLLMAIGGLFKADVIDWVSVMTYQAASGAGAQAMRELMLQFECLGASIGKVVNDPQTSVLALERIMTRAVRARDFPCTAFGYPLASSLLPWIDKPVTMGQTREEAKVMAEANKILARQTPVNIDGICVRVGSLRCHAQAITLKLKKSMDMSTIHEMIGATSPWTQIIDNEKDATLTHLTPTAVAGTCSIAIGRIRPMRMGPEYISAFTVGDQLLWGAAEPLRRVLLKLLQKGA